MARILITDGMDQASVHELKQMGHEVVEQFLPSDELGRQIKSFDAVIIRSATKITKEIIDRAQETKRLKLIIRGGVGIDNIDATYAKSYGIKIENTPESSSRSVAELVIGHMFSIARYINISNVTMRSGLWGKKEYQGIELLGKTLGLIGFGRIARETAKIAHAIGMHVVYFTRSGEKAGFPDHQFVPLDELLRISDFISIHIAADNLSEPFIGPQEFSHMKDGVYIINCARGGVIDEEALLRALDTGKVAAAALDVYTQEPVKNEKIFKSSRISLTPHIGANTFEAQQKIGKEIVNIVRYNLC
jgi:D-3-phosphoglycerate dehydrogenase / 2-oxoglutarate reductase